MMIDIIILGIIFVLFILGFQKGALNQFFSIAALMCAVFFAGTIGGKIYTLVHPSTSLSPMYLMPICNILAGMLIYIVLKIISIALERLILGAGFTLERTNQLIGGMFGIVKGLVVVVLVIFVFDLFGNNSFKPIQFYRDLTKDSITVKVVSKINPLQKLAAIPMIMKMREKFEEQIGSNINLFNETMNNDELNKLLNDKAMNQVLNSGDIVNVLRNKELETLMNNPQIKSMLNEINKNKPSNQQTMNLFGN